MRAADIDDQNARRSSVALRRAVSCAGPWRHFTDQPRLPGLCLHVDRAAQHLRIPSSALTLAKEPQIQLRFADADSMERHVGKPVRELGIDIQTVGRRVCLNTKNGLQQLEVRAGRPGLGDVSAGILYGKRARFSLNASVQFRKPVAGEIARRFRDVARDLRGLSRKPIPLEPQCDQTIVVRPDRAAMI